LLSSSPHVQVIAMLIIKIFKVTQLSTF